MKVEVRGYARDCGTTPLVEAEIAGINLPARMNWYRGGGVSMRRSRNAVRISKSPVRLTLNGRYYVRVELTKEEVRALYLQMYGDEISDAFDGLGDIAASRRATRAEDDDQ